MVRVTPSNYGLLQWVLRNRVISAAQLSEKKISCLITLQIEKFIDASIKNARDIRNQLGYVVLMVDGLDRANFILYGSNRFWSVTSGVMVSGVHGLVLGYDYAFTLVKMIEELPGNSVQLDPCVDSPTLLNVVANKVW